MTCPFTTTPVIPAPMTPTPGNGKLKLVIWALMSGLNYHSLAGVKHLVMDFGIGETMAGGILGVRIVVALSAVLILLAGIWIW